MIVEAIQNALKTTLQAAHVVVVDQSAAHAGHASAVASGGGHYAVTVVSERFVGKPLLARHRLVYDALKDLMQHIHALMIQAHTPEEWNRAEKS